MRLFLLTAATMIAFAGNALLNRFGVAGAGMDAASFALIRVLAGAIVLAMLVAVRKGRRGGGLLPRVGLAAVPGVAGLVAYLAGFSVAYTGLGAGPGALILFGTVQITMFGAAVLRGEQVGRMRVIGAGVAFAGLVMVLWPGATPVSPGAAVAMGVAGVGWGIYSLAGAGSADASGSTAVNFVLALPLMLLFWLAMGAAPVVGPGLWLAVVSGAVTSGLGYALWYAVLPALGTQRAAVAQLTVPVIAAAGGAIWLGEGVGWRFVLAAGLVLGGVAVASLSGRGKGQQTLSADP